MNKMPPKCLWKTGLSPFPEGVVASLEGRLQALLADGGDVVQSRLQVVISIPEMKSLTIPPDHSDCAVPFIEVRCSC